MLDGLDRAYVLARFLDNVDKTSTCWLWIGKQYGGYGRLGFGRGRIFRAHRLAWLLFKGEIPEGLIVCHKCDVTRCVNPEHLFLGTNKDNTADMFEKGRANPPAGDEHWNSKLSAQDVSDVRWLTALGVRNKDVAKHYQINPSQVSRIFNGRRRLERS
jgi:hypothetical protein